MSEPTGRIHSIETMGTLDGPGLRTVVFFQGCPLRCKYCHNVDSTLSEGGTIYTVSALLQKVLRDRVYWENYSHRPSFAVALRRGESQVADAGVAGGATSLASDSGGVTISGGDPVFQPEFLVAFVAALREVDVHVAVDTSLACTEDVIDQLVPLVNLWMISLKEFDSERHRMLTGVGNKKIQANIRYLDNQITAISPGHLPKIRHRYVLLPGMTDSGEMLSALGEHCASIQNFELLELLPYSSLGKHKWIEVFGKYDLESIRDGTEEDVKRAKAFLAKFAIPLLG